MDNQFLDADGLNFYNTSELKTVRESPSINLKPKAVSELPSNPDPNTIYYII